MTYVTEDNLTGIALERWQKTPDLRLREVMTSLIKHLHAFVRETEPTEKEWFTAIEWLTRTGKMCTDKRQEFILTSDVLGVSMLVDAINHRFDTGATPTTVEGPFHVADAPEVANGGDMAKGAPGTPCYVTGTVRGLDGRPVGGAVLDLWQTDGEGLYEAQRDNITGPWMRGLYHTQPDGSFRIRTVAPIAYSIPMDGTVGELVQHAKVPYMRPAHIHFCIAANGYHRVVTHLFQDGDKFIETDAVYGVKSPLIVDFKLKQSGKTPAGEMLDTPFYEVAFDFVLQPQAQAIAAE
ncbi:MAG: catechol 1,2-dioxygenase [Rhizobiales bacterium]|nr:catechol 1,2-dioxygenase [Hyphomicrobiales bacterium]